jgi:hypothetical protein
VPAHLPNVATLVMRLIAVGLALVTGWLAASWSSGSASA